MVPRFDELLVIHGVNMQEYRRASRQDSQDQEYMPTPVKRDLDHVWICGGGDVRPC